MGAGRQGALIQDFNALIDDVCRILIRHKKAGGSFFALIGSQAVRPLGNGAENRQIVFYVFLIPKCVFGQKQRQFRMQAGRRGEGFSVIREILFLYFCSRLYRSISACSGRSGERRSGSRRQSLSYSFCAARSERRKTGGNRPGATAHPDGFPPFRGKPA